MSLLSVPIDAQQTREVDGCGRETGIDHAVVEVGACLDGGGFAGGGIDDSEGAAEQVAVDASAGVG
ncbi:MAG: hypothetical protein FJW36_24145 [Acidobacteria bacterium]|nr:hypothetical protein [Acidobacteriota bacterium]